MLRRAYGSEWCQKASGSELQLSPFPSFSCKSREQRADELTSGLEPLTYSHYEFVYTLSSSSRSVRESACPCCYSVDRIRRLIRYVPVRINRVAVRLQ